MNQLKRTAGTMVMKMAILAILAASGAASAMAQVPEPAYTLAASIPAADGSWDFSGVDPSSGQLFIARGTAITAIALASGQVTDRLAPAQKAHAVLPIPGTGALLETDGATNGVRLIDEATGAQRWALATGQKPDDAIWDQARSRAIVMHNQGGTVALVDVAHAKVTASIMVAPGLESAAVDQRGLLWINSEITNQLIPVDLDAGKALAPIVLPGCEGASGLVYAAKHDQLFSVCGSGYAYVVDARTRQMVTRYAIGTGADAALIDEARGVIAVPCADATLWFFSLLHDAIVPDGKLATEERARSGAIDPATGTIYLPTARFMPAIAGGKRQAVPGTFHVLVIRRTVTAR